MALATSVPSLVGRAAELARLQALLAAANRGQSAALVIHGAPGVGKTALLDAVVARAEGFRVLRAAGVEVEADVPYAGLHELLRPVLEQRKRIPAAQCAALERALALADMSGGDRFAVGAALLSLLGVVGEEAPLLCVVDDVQWLDAASLEALRFAARRVMGEGAVVLLACRGATAPDAELPGIARLRVTRWMTRPRASWSARGRTCLSPGTSSSGSCVQPAAWRSRW